MREPSAETRAKILEDISRSVPDHPLTAVGDINRVLALAPTVGTLISPVRAVDFIPQMHAVSFRYVFLDWRVERGRGDRIYVKGDCYNASFTKGGSLAISQQGILALWRAAGGRDVSSVRMDDKSDPLVAEFQSTVSLKGIDGREVETVKSREVDLRPASPETKSMTDAQYRQATQNVARMAETKAQLRAIRSALDLEQMYPLEVLERPFIIPIVLPMIDDDDPAIRRLMAAKALGVVGELYGATAAARMALPEAEAPAVVDAEPVPGGSVNGHGEFHEAEVVVPEDAYDDLPPSMGPSTPVCECPCGDPCCGVSLDDERAEKTRDRVGSPRCAACFPSVRTFDVAKHRGVKDLMLAKRPDLTVETIAEAQKVAK